MQIVVLVDSWSITTSSCLGDFWWTFSGFTREVWWTSGQTSDQASQEQSQSFSFVLSEGETPAQSELLRALDQVLIRYCAPFSALSQPWPVSWSTQSTPTLHYCCHLHAGSMMLQYRDAIGRIMSGAQFPNEMWRIKHLMWSRTFLKAPDELSRVLTGRLCHAAHIVGGLTVNQEHLVL